MMYLAEAYNDREIGNRTARAILQQYEENLLARWQSGAALVRDDEPEQISGLVFGSLWRRREDLYDLIEHLAAETRRQKRETRRVAWAAAEAFAEWVDYQPKKPCEIPARMSALVDALFACRDFVPQRGGAR